jgi:sialidase-1
MGVKHGKDILAFCNNADLSRRNNLLLQISYDERNTWEKKFLMYKNQSDIMDNYDYSAYCDLIQLDQKRIGILYEKDNYASITFSVKKW